MIDLLIMNPNCFYVIRIDGEFRSVKTRSVPPQEKPYPVLSEVTKHQSVFKFENVKGTILGFGVPNTRTVLMFRDITCISSPKTAKPGGIYWTRI